MKNLLCALFLLLSAACLSAVDWPVRNREVVTTFGSNRGGRFAVGLSISGKNSAVRAVAEGEIIFSADADAAGRALPSGLGNFIAVRHEDGLKSIYTHLKDGSIRSGKDDNFRVAEGALIGELGDSGWSYGKQLGLVVIDSEFKQFVNPLLFLPSVIDTVKPLVSNLRFRRGDTVIPLEEEITVEAGRYNVLADIYDLSEYTNGLHPTAPFQVTLYINGSETNRYTFEALQEIEGEIILQKSDGRSFSEVYAGERTLNLGKYDVIPGNMSIEIIVSDFAGNETDVIRNIIIVSGKN